jgi:hypothetical protein
LPTKRHQVRVLQLKRTARSCPSAGNAISKSQPSSMAKSELVEFRRPGDIHHWFLIVAQLCLVTVADGTSVRPRLISDVHISQMGRSDIEPWPGSISTARQRQNSGRSRVSLGFGTGADGTRQNGHIVRGRSLGRTYSRRPGRSRQSA